jgi:hypothetical protein
VALLDEAGDGRFARMALPANRGWAVTEFGPDRSGRRGDGERGGLMTAVVFSFISGDPTRLETVLEVSA